MKILITGATGFIGGRLSKFLKKKKLKIIQASRKKNSNNLTYINWSSNNNLENLCKNIDIIINCAGFDVYKSKTKSKSILANSVNPYNLFKAANKKNVKLFVFLSTAHVYKNKLSGKINEKNKAYADHIYGLSKLDGEKRLLNFKNKITKLLILRPCNLFGYPNYKNNNCWKLLINSLIKDLTKKNKAIILSKENSYRNYSSVESFCEFIYSIIKKFESYRHKIPTIMNYHSEKNLTVKQISQIILKKIRKVQKRKKIQIFYKHKVLKKMHKLYYTSLYQKNFKSRYDSFFNKEISNLISHCKKLI